MPDLKMDRSADPSTSPVVEYGASRKPHRTWLLPLVWAAVFVLALAIDVPLATWVHDNKWSDRGIRKAHRLLFYLGNFWASGVIGLLLGFFHAWRWRAAIVLWLSGATGGVFYALLKWAVGRTRPFKGNAAFELEPFAGGPWTLFVPRGDVAFPSGHATLAFAMAVCLYRFYPRWRWRWLFYVIATLIAIQRVSRGAHYPSDVVAGAGLGLISAWLVLEVARNHGFIPPAEAKPEANSTEPSAAL